jgi:hypothetical protein
MIEVHTCNLRSLQGELKVNLASGVYAVAQTLVTAEGCAYHMPVVDWVYLAHLAIVGACASANRETVDSVPTVVAGKMCTVHGHLAAEAYCSANYSEDLQMNAPSVKRDAASVQQVVVEVGKSLDLSPAEVAQGMRFVELLDGTEHPLW